MLKLMGLIYTTHLLPLPPSFFKSLSLVGELEGELGTFTKRRIQPKGR